MPLASIAADSFFKRECSQSRTPASACHEASAQLAGFRRPPQRSSRLQPSMTLRALSIESPRVFNVQREAWMHEGQGRLDLGDVAVKTARRGQCCSMGGPRANDPLPQALLKVSFLSLLGIREGGAEHAT